MVDKKAWKWRCFLVAYCCFWQYCEALSEPIAAHCIGVGGSQSDQRVGSHKIPLIRLFPPNVSTLPDKCTPRALYIWYGCLEGLPVHAVENSWVNENSQDKSERPVELWPRRGIGWNRWLLTTTSENSHEYENVTDMIRCWRMTCQILGKDSKLRWQSTTYHTNIYGRQHFIPSWKLCVQETLPKNLVMNK